MWFCRIHWLRRGFVRTIFIALPRGVGMNIPPTSSVRLPGGRASSTSLSPEEPSEKE